MRVPAQRALALAATAILAVTGAAAAGCGGDDGAELPDITKRELRDCLAAEGFSTGPLRTGAAISPISPAFRAQLRDGTPLEAVIAQDQRRAERAAADAAARLGGIGEPAPGDLIVRGGSNAFVIFEDPPGDDEREAAASCLG